MSTDHQDRTWEILARQEPYWAVDTREKFRGQNLTDHTVREFFQTGVDHVDFVFETIRRRLDPHFAPRSALDFDCGVGRLLIPLARRCECVIGVDVSETMLQEAQNNCERQGISNVRLIKSDGSDLATLSPVDLVHSFIVFQHLSPQRGEAIFRRLIPLVKTKGIGVLHFTYMPKHRRSALRRLLARVIRRIKGRFVPVMEMKVYNLNRLVAILQEQGIRRLYVEMTDHDFYGVLLFFQNTSTSEGEA